MDSLWFVPGEGIERTVISSSIQRYLGNDATVKPGLGQGEHEGVPGYYIKAFRNLTSSQVEDLRMMSQKYRSDASRRTAPPPPAATDPRVMRDHGPSYQSHQSYNPSHPYHNQVPGRGRAGGDSPNGMDTGYPNAGPRLGDRYGAPAPVHRMPEPVDVDMDGGYGQAPSYRYDDEPRRFGDARMHDDDRPVYHDTRPSYGADPYGYRPPTGTGAGPFPSDPRMGPGMDYRTDLRPGQQYGGAGPTGMYPRQSDPSFGYPTSTSAPPAPHLQPPYSSGDIYSPPPGPPPGRMEGGRFDGRDPRYQPPNEYSDRDASRYAYPSPPVTVVGARDGMPNAPSPSGFPGQGHSTNGAYNSYNPRSNRPSEFPPSLGIASSQPSMMGGQTSSAGYGSSLGAPYQAKTSPSQPSRGIPSRRGADGSEDGEPPARRMRNY